jgi:hypothetical protein
MDKTLAWASQDDDPDTKVMNVGELSRTVNNAEQLPDLVKQRQVAAAEASKIKQKAVTETKSSQGTFAASSTKGQLDSRFVDIATLSHFLFYDFTALSVRPLNALDLGKLTRSVKEQSTRLQIDVMSACMSESGYELSVPDYHYVLCWQRLNSFKKKPITAGFTCTDENHNKRVEEGELAEITLNNSVSVEITDLKYKELDLESCKSFMTNFFESTGIVLSIHRVADLIELEELDVPEDEQWLSIYANHISHKHHGVTLAERRAFLLTKLEELPPDVIDQMDEWINEVADHGVYSYIVQPCKECGSKHDVRLVIDLNTFLTRSV